MTYRKNKIDVLVQTCDAYSHFWNGWYKMFDRFWAFDLDWQIYFCNEEIDFPYDDPRIKQIKTGKSKQYMGVMQIEARDPVQGMLEQVQFEKTIRIVSTIEFYLE